jgi:hypothetical protein
MSHDFKLVPASMLLDKTTIGAINFHCGDGSNLTIEECSEGILWVGTVTDDEGKEVYGLHIQTAEYPEEGSTTLVEFAAPVQPVSGDPEVLAVVTLGGYFSSDELGDIDIEPRMQSLERIQQEVVRSDSDEHIELIDRAYATRLQAEVSRLNYKAELYDEVWQKARDMGFMNVTMALEALANIKRGAA